MRCLVTGASGHLGSYLTRLLLRQEWEVAVLVRPRADLWRLADVRAQTRLIEADLAHIDRAAGAVTALAPDVVFHLAWTGVFGDDRESAEQINTNLNGSLRLLRVALDAGCKCWVGIGSQAEYGRRRGILREGLAPRPLTLYGTVKLALGLLSRRLCETAGVRHLWFRLLATYGPRDHPQRLIPSVIRSLLAGEKPALTPGGQRWDYLFVSDAAEAIQGAAADPRVGGVFNLASGQARPLRTVVRRIRDLIDPALPVGFGELPYPPGQIMHLQADISRLRRVTGWTPRVSMDKGLQATVAWYRDARRR